MLTIMQIWIRQVLRAAGRAASQYVDCGPHWWTRISQVSPSRTGTRTLCILCYIYRSEIYLYLYLYLSCPVYSSRTICLLWAESNRARLSDHYAFVKPNDRRALDLMNAAAVEVMKELPDLCIGYGVSDEFRYAIRLFNLTSKYFICSLYRFSFVFHPNCQLFERRNG